MDIRKLFREPKDPEAIADIEYYADKVIRKLLTTYSTSGESESVSLVQLLNGELNYLPRKEGIIDALFLRIADVLHQRYKAMLVPIPIVSINRLNGHMRVDGMCMRMIKEPATPSSELQVYTGDSEGKYYKPKIDVGTYLQLMTSIDDVTIVTGETMVYDGSIQDLMNNDSAAYVADVCSRIVQHVGIDTFGRFLITVSERE